MKISRRNKYNKGKLRAFFDLELDMGITIKGFKMMELNPNIYIDFSVFDPEEMRRDFDKQKENEWKK